MEDSKPRVRVEMLGGFAITAEDVRVTESSRKSSKVWRLIQYLVSHRSRAIPQEELIEIFCNDEKNSNPGGSLRTLVYRARSTLEESGLECAVDLIVAKSGCYSWNNSIPCTTDTEEFEYYTKKAKTCSNEDEKRSLLLKAVDLYKGNFLTHTSGDAWVVPLACWYRDLYMRAVRDVLEIMQDAEYAVDAEGLCVRALEIDPYDETVIKYYLRDLIRQGKTSEALGAYKQIEAVFFDELGVDFSEDLHALYNELQKTDENLDEPLRRVIQEWLEDETDICALKCDVSDFKMLCKVESRSAPRSGQTAFVIRINVKHEPQDAKFATKNGGVIKNLERAISTNLRTSDVFTRSSPSQYMVLLRGLAYEDCKMLVNRILGRLDSRYLPRITETSIAQVTPAGY